MQTAACMLHEGYRLLTCPLPTTKGASVLLFYLYYQDLSIDGY